MDDADPPPITIQQASPLRSPDAAELVHTLTVVRGDHPRESVVLGPEPLVLGRDARRPFHLPDPEVSRAHCALTCVEGRVGVRDLGSTNGTYVEGLRLEPEREVELLPGALLQVGQHVLRHDLFEADEYARQRELVRELERARRYVEALIPPPIVDGPWLLDQTFAPSAELGGDALGHRWIDDQRLALFVVDVCGHGVGSALHAAAVLGTLLRGIDDAALLADPSRVLGRLEALYPMEEHGELYFSLWYGVFDTTDGSLPYASAGHPPALVTDSAGCVVARLATRNPPIGTLGPRAFQADEARLAAGQRLYLFTDGVYELTAADGRELGLAEFEALLLDAPYPSSGESGRILAAVRERTGLRQLPDDFSLLVLAPASSPADPPSAS